MEADKESKEVNELLENGKSFRVLRSSAEKSSFTKFEDVEQASIIVKLRRVNVNKRNKEIQTNEYQQTPILKSSGHIKSISEKIAKQHVAINGTQMHKDMLNEKLSGKGKQPAVSTSSTLTSAYQIYKAAGEWWNIFPKTDYTYSKSSVCRKEISPGVIPMPNMSRSGLHSYRATKEFNKASEFQSTVNERTARSSLKHTGLHSEYSDIDEVDEVHISRHTMARHETSIIKRVITSIWTFVSYILSVITLRKQHLGCATPTPSRRVPTTWFNKLEVKIYRLACYYLLLDIWLLRLFRQPHNHQGHQRTSIRKYLLFLLIPLLLLAGLWWYTNQFENFVFPVTLTSSWINSLPFLWGQKPLSPIKLEEKFEDDRIEMLARKVITSSEFKDILMKQNLKLEQAVASREHIAASEIQVEKDKLKMELDHKNKQLSEQEALHSHLSSEIANLKKKLEVLKAEFDMRTKGTSQVNANQMLLTEKLRKTESQMRTLQTNRLLLSHKFDDCCKRTPPVFPGAAIEEHVVNFLSGLFDFHKDEAVTPENLKLWIKQLFVAKHDLEQRLSNISSDMNRTFREAQDKTAQMIMLSVSEKLKEELLRHETKQKHNAEMKALEADVWAHSESGGCDNCTLTAERIKEIVNTAINKYDADKTGMVDYALESSGGTVISTKCTENYNAKAASLTWFGSFLLTFPWSNNHPRIVLQPGIQPGNCWAFRGVQGYLIIQLSAVIHITGFSMEHIPRSLSPTGNINSSPRNFSVWGLTSEDDKNPLLLGKYVYQENGTSLQFFPIQKEQAPPFEMVELHIESNHGNMEYTCLYRFRVHGVLVDK